MLILILAIVVLVGLAVALLGVKVFFCERGKVPEQSHSQQPGDAQTRNIMRS